jgi:hypothetical protein
MRARGVALFPKPFFGSFRQILIRLTNLPELVSDCRSLADHHRPNLFGSFAPVDGIAEKGMSFRPPHLIVPRSDISCLSHTKGSGQKMIGAPMLTRDHVIYR